MGDGSLEERGVWELVYVGVGCRTLQPRVTVCVCGGAGVLLSGTLESCGPAFLKGSILPGADTSTPCSPVHPLQAPRGPPARIEDTLFSSNTAPWTGSLIRRLFHVGKDPHWFPCRLGPAWRTPSPSLIWPPPFWTWLQILGCKPAGTDGCRLEGQAAPREVILTKGRPQACSWCGGLSCGHHEPRTGPCRKMRSGRLEQVEPSFSQVCLCVSVQLSSAHSSPKQGSDLLQNWNQLQA